MHSDLRVDTGVRNVIIQSVGALHIFFIVLSVVSLIQNQYLSAIQLLKS